MPRRRSFWAVDARAHTDPSMFSQKQELMAAWQASLLTATFCPRTASYLCRKATQFTSQPRSQRVLASLPGGLQPKPTGARPRTLARWSLAKCGIAALTSAYQHEHALCFPYRSCQQVSSTSELRLNWNEFASISHAARMPQSCVVASMPCGQGTVACAQNTTHASTLSSAHGHNGPAPASCLEYLNLRARARAAKKALPVEVESGEGKTELLAVPTPLKPKLTETKVTRNTHTASLRLSHRLSAPSRACAQCCPAVAMSAA